MHVPELECERETGSTQEGKSGRGEGVDGTRWGRGGAGIMRTVASIMPLSLVFPQLDSARLRLEELRLRLNSDL